MPRSSIYEKVRRTGMAMLIRACFDWYVMHRYAIWMRMLLASPIGLCVCVPLSNYERNSVYLLNWSVTLGSLGPFNRELEWSPILKHEYQKKANFIRNI